MIKKKKIIIVCTCIVILAVALAICLSVLLKEDEKPEDDFSDLAWTKAFEQLNDTMRKKYAFSEWKDVQWRDLYDKYSPRIEAAQANDSFEEYYLAMISYVSEIQDGHVSISHDTEIDNKYVGGSFGFNVTRLDNGKVIVTWIDPDGPAVDKGIVIGDEITLWNGQPISSAIDSVSTIFSSTAATTESLMQKKLTYLVRAPINTEVTVTLADSRSVVIKAYDDQRTSILSSYPYTVVSIEKNMALVSMLNGNPNPEYGPEGVVETELLEGNVLYVKLWALFDLDTDNSGTPKSTMELMRKAVAYANENGCTDMILDVRNNIGGSDDMVAEILGLFYTEKTLYEIQKYTITDDMPQLYIEPEPQHFSGNIIVLVNTQCVSSGEGIALGINNLENGETLGFYGTNGSFGLTGGLVKMPDEIVINYPLGQSLDKNKTVQIDSKNGVGGVSPTIRIPMNEENALKIASGVDVELEEALRILREN